MPIALIYTIGFLAQSLFFTRSVVQWLMSERYKRVVSPTIFWVFSLMGSILQFIYGIFRIDFSIILGQLITYYIYIWNLNIKGFWKKLSYFIKIPIFLLPVFALIYLLHDVGAFFAGFLHNKNIPMNLLIFGSAGQIIFSLRFIYQWYQSYLLKKSVLSVGFWVISIIGSGIIFIYGVIRRDPVLILAQSFGCIAYIRNIIIHKKQKAE